MKLIDRETGTIVADVLANHNMSIDEVLDLMGFSVAEDGQIFYGEKGLYADYDNLETCDSTIGHWDKDSWGSAAPPPNAYELINKANDLVDVFHVQNGFDSELTREFSNNLWDQYCKTGKVEASVQKKEIKYFVKYFIKRGELYFKDFMGEETPNGLAKWTRNKNEARAFDTRAKAQSTKDGIIPYNGKGISIAAEAVEKKPSVRDWLKEASSAQADAPKASTPRKEAPSL